MIVVTGGKQSQLLASALGLGWSLTIKTKTERYKKSEIPYMTKLLNNDYEAKQSIIKSIKYNISLVLLFCSSEL